MKLIFDQNLSPRLPRLLLTLYPGSLHVRDLGMKDASDSMIWNHARNHGFVIVSKDSDFQQRSLLYGHPPKFIWLRVGNCATQIIEKLLRKHVHEINAFENNPVESHFMLP